VITFGLTIGWWRGERTGKLGSLRKLRDIRELEEPGNSEKGFGSYRVTNNHLGRLEPIFGVQILCSLEMLYSQVKESP
jgi:hypothetical protein